MNMAKASTHDPRLGARSVSRKLALLAMYRVQVNEGPWQDLITEFSTAEDMPRADREYFDELIRGIATGRDALDARMAEWLDRRPDDLGAVPHP